MSQLFTALLPMCNAGLRECSVLAIVGKGISVVGSPEEAVKLLQPGCVYVLQPHISRPMLCVVPGIQRLYLRQPSNMILSDAQILSGRWTRCRAQIHCTIPRFGSHRSAVDHDAQQIRVKMLHQPQGIQASRLDHALV